MPLTPESWSPEVFVANFSGNQVEPQITQLGNGNIVVAWEDSTNNVDSSGGSDIIGQIYDPLGNPVGGPFRVNASFTGDNEGEFEIATTSDGGFVTVYEDTNGSGTSIRATYRDASGGLISTDTIQSDPGVDELNDPSVTVAANGDILFAWNRTDDATGNVTAFTLFYDQSTDTYGAVTSTLASGNATTTGSTQNNSVTALSDGTFVLVTPRAFGNDDIIGRKVNADGSVTGNTFFVIGNTGTEDTQPDVIALEGGGFVAVWRQFDGTDRDAFFRVYDNSASPVTGVLGIATGGTADNKNELSVGALADGGFVVVFDDDETNEIRGQRFNATGSVVGGNFLVTDSSAESQPEIIGLGDGRFAVTWQTNDGLGSESIELEIFDTRDNANTSAVYTPDNWQIGTVGDDVFTAVGGSGATVHGHDGNDTITEAGNVKNYFGGEGNDTIRVVSGINSDLHDGGNGNDTIDWTLAGVVNGTYDLTTRTASLGNSSESILDFENVIGTNNVDTINGDNGDNSLSGLNGNDTIDGRDGDDVINGGDNDDVLTGGDGKDIVNGGAGNDTIRQGNDGTGNFANGGTGTDTLDFSDSTFGWTYSRITSFGSSDDGSDITTTGIENIIGSNLNDILFSDGPTTILGGAGNDTIHAGLSSSELLDGGAGSGDILDARRFDGDYEVNLTTGNTNFAPESFINFERLFTGIGNDSIIGTSGNNLLDASSGDDTIEGLGGADTIRGDAGIDTASYESSNAAVTVNLATNVNTGGDAQGDSLSRIENLIGSGLGDTLIGDANANLLMGGDGSDTLNGSNGNDVLSGGDGDDLLIGGQGNDDIGGSAGNDRIRANSGLDSVNGGAGDDRIDGASGGDNLRGGGGEDVVEGEGGNDTINGGDDDDRVRGGGGFDTVTGADGDDRVEGNGGDDFVNGGNGEDEVTGGGGDDTITGGNGNDFLNGNNGNDIISGNNDNDELFGGGGVDTLFGGNGNDELSGDAGNDALTGGAGADTFMFGNNFDRDDVLDFEDNIDFLAIDDNLYGGGRTAAQIINDFGSNIAGGCALQFRRRRHSGGFRNRRLYRQHRQRHPDRLTRPLP